MLRSNPINPDSRLEKEAMTLGKAGHEIHLFGWLRFGNAPKFEKKQYYDISRFSFKAPLGKKVLFFLPVWWLSSFFFLMKSEWDVVHAADFDTYIPALFATKIKNKKIIYDIFDFYADMAVMPNFIRVFIACFDKFLIKFADAVIIADPSRLHQIQWDFAYVIYNSPSEGIISTFPHRIPSNQNFRIFYAGSFAKDRDIASMISVIKNLEFVNLELAGWGECEKELADLIKNIPNISFLGMISYEQVIQKTLQSDLLFALYNPIIRNNRYASPNKLFEAMMCRKPIIVNDGTTMADIVRKENCGIVIPYGDIRALKNAVITLKNNQSLCHTLGDNGRSAFEKEYSWEIMERNLISLYQNFQ